MRRWRVEDPLWRNSPWRTRNMRRGRVGANGSAATGGKRVPTKLYWVSYTTLKKELRPLLSEAGRYAAYLLDFSGSAIRASMGESFGPVSWGVAATVPSAAGSPSADGSAGFSSAAGSAVATAGAVVAAG